MRLLRLEALGREAGRHLRRVLAQVREQRVDAKLERGRRRGEEVRVHVDGFDAVHLPKPCRWRRKSTELV